MQFGFKFGKRSSFPFGKKTSPALMLLQLPIVLFGIMAGLLRELIRPNSILRPMLQRMYAMMQQQQENTQKSKRPPEQRVSAEFRDHGNTPA